MDYYTLQQYLIAPAASIKDAMRLLNDTGCEILFVVDGAQSVIGTLTDGDIRRGILNGLELTRSVENIVNRQFIFVLQSAADIAGEARALMHTHSISQIPVIDDRKIIRDLIILDEYREKDEASRDVMRFDTPVVIMAGGKGTRLDPFTTILPKPLIPFRNKPIVEHIMDRYFEHGFYKFMLVVNHKKEMIKMYFSEMKHPYQIEFIDEDEYYGTAGGLMLLKGHIQETFLVTNCDTILEEDYLDIVRWHKAKQFLITIVGSHKPMKVPYGVLKMSHGSFLGIEEKPELDLFINTGTYVMEPAVFSDMRGAEPLDMDKLISRVAIRVPEGVGVYPHWKDWFDIGQWSEYQESLKRMNGIPIS